MRVEVIIEDHSLGEVRRNTVQDKVNEVVICYLGIDIESINIVQVFLNSTCLFKITNLIESLV